MRGQGRSLRRSKRVTNKRAGKQVSPFHAFKTLLHCIETQTRTHTHLRTQYTWIAYSYLYLYLCRVPKHMHTNFVPFVLHAGELHCFCYMFDVVRHVIVQSRCTGCVFVVAAFCNTHNFCVFVCVLLFAFQSMLRTYTVNCAKEPDNVVTHTPQQ